ncbi:hypothetical protein [Nonomuraea sp. NPDC050310]|uniref:hypothetical protein n=1 Tax=Nonomuraea sp. NPDC050310 TaxID=3154935 RepID=UPI0033BFCFCA
MTVTVPLVAILAAIVFVAWRHLGLRLWHALTALTCGFLLAATTLAPDIQQAIDAALSWLADR